MKSAIQSERECYICKTTYNLHRHHIFSGTANRKLSEKYGYWIYLCVDHHVGANGVHQARNYKYKLEFMRMAQRHFERNHGTRNDFIKVFGKSYLED